MEIILVYDILAHHPCFIGLPDLLSDLFEGFNLVSIAVEYLVDVPRRKSGVGQVPRLYHLLLI